MKLGTLIEALAEIREQFGDDAEVVLMTQSKYPMEYTLQGVTTRDEYKPGRGNEEDGRGTDVILCEGRWLRYGSTEAWNDLCFKEEK